MSTVNAGARAAWVAACLVLFVLGAAGCGHGRGYHRVRARGTLEVYNVPASFAAVDGVETVLAYGPYAEFHPVFAPPGTGVFFDLVADPYDVTIYWNNGDFDVFFDVRIRPYDTTSLAVRY